MIFLYRYHLSLIAFHPFPSLHTQTYTHTHSALSPLPHYVPKRPALSPTANQPSFISCLLHLAASTHIPSLFSLHFRAWCCKPDASGCLATLTLHRIDAQNQLPQVAKPHVVLSYFLIITLTARILFLMVSQRSENCDWYWPQRRFIYKIRGISIWILNHWHVLMHHDCSQQFNRLTSSGCCQQKMAPLTELRSAHICNFQELLLAYHS